MITGSWPWHCGQPDTRKISIQNDTRCEADQRRVTAEPTEAKHESPAKLNFLTKTDNPDGPVIRHTGIGLC